MPSGCPGSPYRLSTGKRASRNVGLLSAAVILVLHSVLLVCCSLSLLSSTMHFPFSFVFSVPGMVNPFAPVPSSQAAGPSRTVEAATMNGTANWPVDVKPLSSDLPRRRLPTPTMSQPQLLSRKRGWAPAISEPSESTTVPASTSGYLDTPFKYRDLSSTPSEDIEDMDDMVAGVCSFWGHHAKAREQEGSDTGTG